MCEFVEDTPESYDDVMTSGLNSEIKKTCFTFLSTFFFTYYILCIILFFFFFLLILLNIVDTSDNYEQVRFTEPYVFTLFMFT